MPTNGITFEQHCSHYSERVNRYLKKLLSHQKNQAESLQQAIEYTCLNGGKRVRALLVYTTADALAIPSHQVDSAAAAVELIHSYSLIHDDLPAMDDSDFRRGKLACHKAFDEATAILAGDAQQALAFSILAQQPAVDAKCILQMMTTLSQAALHMVDGQALDISADAQTELDGLQAIHAGKTAALIKASILLGAFPAHPNPATLKALNNFGYHLGMAFQIQDDILDVEGSADALGKPVHADDILDKITYPGLLGLTAAKKSCHEHYDHAITTLNILDYDTKLLRELAQFMTERNH